MTYSSFVWGERVGRSKYSILETEWYLHAGNAPQAYLLHVANHPIIPDGLHFVDMGEGIDIILTGIYEAVEKLAYSLEVRVGIAQSNGESPLQLHDKAVEAQDIEKFE